MVVQQSAAAKIGRHSADDLVAISFATASRAAAGLAASSMNSAGKEIALADQRGLVYKHRHALTLTLPRAMVVGKTAAS